MKKPKTCAGPSLCRNPCRILCRQLRRVSDVSGDVNKARGCVRMRAKNQMQKHLIPKPSIRHTRHADTSLLNQSLTEKIRGTGKDTDGTDSQSTCTIRCTPENAKEFQATVRHWPELHSLVKDLQAQNLFPGLRAMQITLTGPEKWVGKGLGALAPQNAPDGAKGGQQ